MSQVHPPNKQRNGMLSYCIVKKAFLELKYFDFMFYLLVVLTICREYNVFAMIPMSTNHTKW